MKIKCHDKHKRWSKIRICMCTNKNYASCLWTSLTRVGKCASHKLESPLTLNISHLCKRPVLLLFLISKILERICSISEFYFVNVEWLDGVFPRKIIVAQDAVKIFPSLFGDLINFELLWAWSTAAPSSWVHWNDFRVQSSRIFMNSTKKI